MEKLSYIAHRRAKFNSISGVVNIPWGTGLEAVDGFIWWGNKCLCATKSETAHLFFAINEDGRGLERGAATVAIINTLAKPGMDHQKRWDRCGRTAQPRNINAVTIWITGCGPMNFSRRPLRTCATLPPWWGQSWRCGHE